MQVAQRWAHAGINVRGAVRDIMELQAGGKELYIIARNNAVPVFYTAAKAGGTAGKSGKRNVKK